MKREEDDFELTSRTVRLPAFVWRALDEDAERCRRSANRQIEAILVRYYELEADVELSEPQITRTASAVSRRERKTGTHD